MRIISIRTLKEYWETIIESEAGLKSWIQEVEKENWENSSELKQKFGNASILNSKRVVFNVHGNKYRLIVDIEYRLKIIFVVWIGTHEDYNKIDAKEVKYDKSNKK